MSHSGGHVVVAVADVGPIGIDVQRIDAQSADIAETVLASCEAQMLQRLAGSRRAYGLTRYWVRKEALLKAIGTGLRLPPSAVRVTGPDEPPSVIAESAAPTRNVALADIDVDDRHLAAIAVMEHAIPPLTHYFAGPMLAHFTEETAATRLHEPGELAARTNARSAR